MCVCVCVCVCVNALLLKGSYVLMRCKWLQEVVSHSLNGTPPHLWSPDFGGLGVVIVMLPRPPDRLWRIGLGWSIDRHVAASFSFSSPPSHIVLPRAVCQEISKKSDSLPHEVPQRESIVQSKKCHVPAASNTQIKTDFMCDNLCKALYI